LDVSGNVNVSGGVSTNTLTATGGITANATQSITFGTNAPTMSGANIGTGTIGQTQVSNGYVNLSTAQDISGAKTFTISPLVPTVSPLGDYSNKVVNTQYLADYFNASQLQDAYFQFPLGAPIGNIAPTVIHNYLTPSTTSIKMPNETLLSYVGFRYIIYPDRQWSSLSSSVPITTITGSTFVFNGQIVSSITMDVNNSFIEIMCINLGGSGVCWSVIRKDPNSLLSSTNTWTNTNTFSSPPVMSGASITAGSIPTSAIGSGFVDLTTNQTITTGTKTFSSSPIIKSQFVRSSLYATGTTLNISSGTLQPVYCLLPTGNMTITLPTASATFDGAVILFYRVGGTNTLTVNSASSNIYNYSLTFTNSILIARQTIRQIICQQNNGVYAWYYVDSDELLYSSNTWYGANTYTVNPTFATNRALYYLDAGNNIIGVGNSTSTSGIQNIYIGTQSGSGNAGNYNVCLGFQTLSRGGNLQGHSCFGYRAGADFVSGTINNVAIGLFAGLGATYGDSENTYIGNGAGSDGLARYDNSIAIGRYAKVFASNVLVFGGTDGIYGYPVSYFMGGCVVPATKNLSLQGCLLSATQTYNTNNSVLSLTGAKMVYVTANTVTQLYLPLPTAADVGKIFTISKSGGATWGLALRRNVGTTFTIDYGGLATNEVYPMEVSEFTVDIMVMSSATSGVCYNVLYTTPTVFRNQIVYTSPFFLPPQSFIPATRSNINTIVIGQDALITVSSGTHADSNTVIGAGAGKVISSNPSALTIIGREAMGLGTAFGSSNTALGYRAGYNQTTGASVNCSFLGAETAVSSATTAYSKSSAVGHGSTISRSNEVVLGTATETVFVPGLLQVDNNYVAGASPTLITGNTTLSGAVYQFYSVSLNAGNITITLPAASADYLGCSITFRRVGSNSSNQIFSASTNLYQYNGFGTTNIIMTFDLYNSTIICMLLDATPTYGWFHYIFNF
jgi:hypothetical protein